MQSSFFERLPAELRNLCYEHALYEPKGARIRNEPSLLSTCKAIREEAELMYYAINDFEVTIHEDHINHDLCQWLQAKSGPRIRSIRSLSLHVQMPWISAQPANATNGSAEGEDDECGSRECLHLMHIMKSVRTVSFNDRSLEKVIRFTLNGARDDEHFDKIEQMSTADQDRYRGAKFLILSLVHGEAATVEALENDDCELRLEELDRALRERRAAA
ncbi:hypothetical protein BST61_g5834 [Cercospora zeina]